MNLLKVSSPLPEDLERLVHEIIGACMRVHSELGPGLLETSYARALASELAAYAVPFEMETIVPVIYRACDLSRPDHQPPPR
jgi:GxxExxY protein